MFLDRIVVVSNSISFLFFRMIKEDTATHTLDGLVNGFSMSIKCVQVHFQEHFSKIKTVVDELVENLRSKRTCLEAKLISPSDYGKNCFQDQMVKCHRFSSELHVGLQVEAFCFKSDEVIESKYYRVASTLMQEMSHVFDSELGRLTAFREIVKDLGKMFALQDLTGRSDGTVTTVQGIHISNWEFKNEFVGVSSCPVTQNHAYFMRIKTGTFDRSPMLLVSVVGCHYLQVFGAVWNGQKCICVDPLGSPVSLLFVPRDPHNGVLTLARLLSTVDGISHRLEEYYAKPEQERVENNRGPYWTDNGRLTYFRKLEENVNWLFVPTRDDGVEVVVKFVRGRYGEAVHRHLASLNFAPKLFTCCPLPGGWYAVVMEKLIRFSVSFSDKAKQSLKKAVEKMHESNYVHGDLREQNITVVDDETVRILDFDWADTEDIATYPPEINISYQNTWHSDVKPGEKIRKDHDIHLIKHICN